MSEVADGLGVVIRRLAFEDAPAFLALVDAHADFEGMARPTPDARGRLIAHALAETPLYRGYVATVGGEGNGNVAGDRNAGAEVVGYAMVFLAYSSFLARPTLFIEDIFVAEHARNRGVGRVFMRALAAEALALECGRMEWMVQHWNEAAIGFYEGLGARPLADWRPYRIDGDTLAALAATTALSGEDGG
jgi:GNAT superfamily N-acetyltransferase